MNGCFSLNLFLVKVFRTNRRLPSNVHKKCLSTATESDAVSAPGEKEELSTPLILEEQDTAELATVELKRDKSRLLPRHRNIIEGRPPFNEPKVPFHNTLKYRRALYGKYGSESGVDPAICFATNEEREDLIEYERIAFPYNILDMQKEAKRREEERKLMYREREKQVEEQLAKQDEWKERIRRRLEEKLAEAEAIRMKREKLIEEVKRHFGYRVDPKDERFLQMLEQKELEERKLKKQEKKKKREELLMEKLAALETSASSKKVEKPSSNDEYFSKTGSKED